MRSNWNSKRELTFFAHSITPGNSNVTHQHPDSHRQINHCHSSSWSLKSQLAMGIFGQQSDTIKRTIKVEVYDWDRDGSHDFIGEFTTSYRELARGQSQFNVYEIS
uniref:Uncharacterized protein n=1 Tax=Sphaerodactylus townsendi TaxID=933632 RepID=A0ACB8F4X5_9SAUR